MNGRPYSLEALTVIVSALRAAPASPARDSCLAKAEEAIDRLLGHRSEAGIMMTLPEAALTAHAVAAWRKQVS